MSYEGVSRIARICHILGAVLLFVMSIIGFAQLNFTSTQFVMYVYYIFFGVLIIFVELGFTKVIEQFYFMNYSFGKALFAGFVATLCYGTNYWVKLAVAIFFTIASGGFLILGMMFTSEETKNAVQKAPSGEENKPAEQKGREMDNKLPAPQV